MGLHGFWCIASWNRNMFTRFGLEQIACQQNAMFVADADWKCLCLDLILAPKRHFCVPVGPTGDFLFSVSNS